MTTNIPRPRGLVFRQQEHGGDMKASTALRSVMREVYRPSTTNPTHISCSLLHIMDYLRTNQLRPLPRVP